ncbi:MAG: BlaI/MecI/CopY family transcriptional regulator [Myxococcales bacterium]|nr:BlaI/MecI/CopY family transcriptional regulator [Myxococcales bacterium]
MEFRIRKGQDGAAIRLHDLEAEIMDVVWSRDLKDFAVSDVHATLEARREIAYTTVMTTLVRLHEKAVLERRRDGKRYLYTPRYSREEFVQATVREVLESIGSAAGRDVLALLVETASAADEAALDELDRMIRRRRRELKR